MSGQAAIHPRGVSIQLSFLNVFYFSSPKRLAAFLIAASLFSSCSPEASSAPANAPLPAAVRATQATSADIPLEIAAIGNVEASSTVEVKARVTAPVLKVHFEEGQDVRQGQLLFDLDPEPFIRQLAEIEANIARDLAMAKQAEANIARELASYKNLDAIASRTVKLSKEGILSREQADQALSNVDASKASLDAGKAAVESAKAAEKADRARLMETRLVVDYTKVYAPIAGRTGVIAARQGSLAKQHDNTLVTILQSSPVYIVFSLPENALPLVRKYQKLKPLEITATAGDVTTKGVLEFIDNSVDTSTGGIKLKAKFANADRVLWPGQFVNVKALLSVEEKRVLVSSQAVQTGPKGKYVWVFNPTTSIVEMRDVTVLRLYTNAARGEQAVIGQGLEAGERVITEGQKRLTPKAKVRLLQP